uniref:Uncharacterized protein n=1 Tax=Arundo donax TaxID=35708 RepID=A0A0A8XMX1_ARUDO
MAIIEKRMRIRTASPFKEHICHFWLLLICINAVESGQVRHSN